MICKKKKLPISRPGATNGDEVLSRLPSLPPHGIIIHPYPPADDDLAHGVMRCRVTRSWTAGTAHKALNAARQ